MKYIFRLLLIPLWLFWVIMLVFTMICYNIFVVIWHFNFKNCRFLVKEELYFYLSDKEEIKVNDERGVKLIKTERYYKTPLDLIKRNVTEATNIHKPIER